MEKKKEKKMENNMKKSVKVPTKIITEKQVEFDKLPIKSTQTHYLNTEEENLFDEEIKSNGLNLLKNVNIENCDVLEINGKKIKFVSTQKIQTYNSLLEEGIDWISFNINSIFTILKNQEFSNIPLPLTRIKEYCIFLQENYTKMIPSNQNKNFNNTEKSLCIAISNDGKNLASGNEDGLIVIWPLYGSEDIDENGKYILNGHSYPVKGIKFTIDSEYLLSGSVDGVVNIWDINKGICIFRKALSIKLNFNCLNFSKDCSKIAGADSIGKIQVWNLEKKDDLDPCNLFLIEESITAIDFSHDSKLIATGGPSQLVQLWNCEMNELVTIFKGHSAGISCINFSPNGKTLASGGGNGMICIWNIETLELEKILKEENDSVVRAITFSLDSKKILTGSNNCELIIWSLKSLRPIRIFYRKNMINSVAFSVSNKFCACGDNGGLVFCTKIAPTQFEANILYRELISEKNKHVENNENIVDFLNKNDFLLNCLAFSPDNEHIAFGTYDGLVTIFNLFNPSIPNFPQRLEKRLVHCLTYNNNGLLLAGGYKIGSINIWNPLSGEIYKQFDGHKATVCTLRFNNDSRFLVSGGFDNIILVWDIEKSFCVRNFSGHEAIVKQIHFSQDYTKLISCSYDHTIRIWDFKTGAVLHKLSHSNFIISIDVLGNSIISSSSDNVMKLWNLSLGSYERKWRRFNRTIKNVQFLNSENKILITYKDEIRILDINTNCEESIKIPSKNLKINCVIANQEGTLIAIALIDKILIISNCLPYFDFIEIMNFLNVMKNSSTVKNIEGEDSKFIMNLNKTYLSEGGTDILRKILPLEMTLIHFLCYLDDAKTLQPLLQHAIENEIYIPPIKDKFGLSPFDILINNGNSTLLENVVKYYSHENIAPLSFQTCADIFTEVVPPLLHLKIPDIDRFLDSRIFDCIGKKPKYGIKLEKQKICIFSTSMPSYSDYTSMIFPNFVDYEFDGSNSIKKSKVFFKVIDFPFITEYRFRFLQYLIDFPSDHSIFSSTLVSHILQYKWEKRGKRNFVFKAIIFCFFVILQTASSVFVYPIRKEGKHLDGVETYHVTSEIIIIILVTYFLFSEIYKMIRGGLVRYTRDLWSFVHLVIIVLTLIISIIGLSIEVDTNSSENIRVLHTVNVLFIYFGLLSYTRIHDTMSFMMRILTRVIFDIRFFLLIVFMMLLAFTYSTYILQETSYKVKKLELFKIFYRMVITDFDSFLTESSTYPKLHNAIWAYFIVGTLLLTTIMLTLLISIISDTYAKVLKNEKLANNYEKALILNEFEHSKKMKPKNSRKRYLFVISNTEGSYKRNKFYIKITEIMKNLKSRIIKLESKVNTVCNQILKIEEVQYKVCNSVKLIDNIFLKKQ